MMSCYSWGVLGERLLSLLCVTNAMQHTCLHADGEVRDGL